MIRVSQIDDPTQNAASTAVYTDKHTKVTILKEIILVINKYFISGCGKFPISSHKLFIHQ